jgi:predicted nuclease with TOPRIM domain
MQISCLEMEKSRRLEERRNAAARIAEIDARLSDIESEKSRLESALDMQGLPRQPVERKETPRRRAERPDAGLRLKY